MSTFTWIGVIISLWIVNSVFIFHHDNYDSLWEDALVREWEGIYASFALISPQVTLQYILTQMAASCVKDLSVLVKSVSDISKRLAETNWFQIGRQ